MSQITSSLRKRSSSFVGEDDSDIVDMQLSKKVKDSEMSETSSEGNSDPDDRLQRMAAAMKTIIEVKNFAYILQSSLNYLPCCSAWERMATEKA